ncbi:UNVERIFIED_CONTAM: hypothetical protein RMT77_013874 [Armadillidium vulgare]
MNLYYTTHRVWYSQPWIDHPNLTDAFMEFYDKSKDKLTDFNKWDCLTNVTGSCFRNVSGFFLSLFHAKQHKIGCGFAECLREEDNVTQGIFICVTNLDMLLDMYGQPLYHQSKKASNCPKPYTLPSTKYPALCRCNNTEGCVTKPAELSAKCTKKEPGAKITLKPTKHFPRMTAARVAETLEKAPPQHQGKEEDQKPTKKKRPTSRTTKKMSGLGGGKDTSGAKSLEDGDNFAFLFMMIWFLFIY